MKYDVLIVGAGTAGIFAALELAKTENLKIAIFDKGKDIDQRDRNSSLLTGWGGAGAFSDGKLTLSTHVGGWLDKFMPEKDLEKLVKQVDDIWIEYGAPDKTYGTDQDEIAEIQRKSAMAELTLVPSEIRHIGTEVCPLVLRRMRDALAPRIDIFTETQVASLITHDSRITGIETLDGKIYEADYVIVSPGREGSDWLASEARRLGLKTITNPVDIGVRVEVPAVTMNEITDVVYEPKLIYYTKSFDDQVRSFCVCPKGEVAVEESDGVRTVNGHSYAHKKTENTNFALLVSTSFTEPFREPITYGRYIATLSNLLSGGVIVQRLGDLQSGRRSTQARIDRGLVKPSLESAVPGDLSFVLPYRHLSAILEMLRAMDKLCPGVGSRHTLLYGVEVKFYSSRLELSPVLESGIHNMFTVGDGAGVTRGLIQASASGIIAAREIIRRTGQNTGK